jgi:tRNA dimethylallyltransferase
LKQLIVITGPTASGKTAVAIELARQYKSEIINADSRQFFREMNIGTAKPTAKELKTVQHHFIDNLSIVDKYNIGIFEKEVLEKLNLLFQTNDTIFLTGGSGLYIDAVCKGIDKLPESSEEIRKGLIYILNTEGIEALQEKLKISDPEHFAKTDIQNPHRLIRALEINMVSGKKVSELQKAEVKKRDFEIKKIGLLADRDELYSKINRRVDEMIHKGLVEEVQSLLPYRSENALQTVGYKEIFDYFENKTSLPEAIELIKQNTRNYAKRQMTWFRKDPDIQWFYPAEIDKMKLFIKKTD